MKMILLTKKMARRLHYYRSKWWWERFRYPRHILHRSLVYMTASTPISGHPNFRIDAYFFHDETPQFRDFVANIGAALDLIARHSPRRYNTVARHIKVIHWDFTSSPVGLYCFGFRLCIVNYKGVFEQRAADGITEINVHNVAYLASLLVHEATHGRIASYYVPYDRANRDDIEKLCLKEEERFMNTLYQNGAYPKVKMRPFDASKWAKYRKDT